jgi:hypothetical protein
MHVHFGMKSVGTPSATLARVNALKGMDAAMTLPHLSAGNACFEEKAVHVCGQHKTLASKSFSQAFQDLVAKVRLCSTV